MSSEATHYVRRHARGVTLVERAVLLTIADRCSATGTTPRGRGPSHATLAAELETSERTVRRWIDSLIEKKALIAPGRCTFEIPGVAEHDPATCGHDECGKAANPNRPHLASNDRRPSSRTGQMWPTNRSDVAAKTFSPTERDRAGRAQGSAQRTGDAASTHSFSNDGSGGCVRCPLPEHNSRHRSPNAKRPASPQALHADLPGSPGASPDPAGAEQRQQDGNPRGDQGEAGPARPAAQDRPDDADRQGAHSGAQDSVVISLPGGRVISLPAFAASGGAP